MPKCVMCDQDFETAHLLRDHQRFDHFGWGKVPHKLEWVKDSLWFLVIVLAAILVLPFVVMFLIGGTLISPEVDVALG